MPRTSPVRDAYGGVREACAGGYGPAMDPEIPQRLTEAWRAMDAVMDEFFVTAWWEGQEPMARKKPWDAEASQRYLQVKTELEDSLDALRRANQGEQEP